MKALLIFVSFFISLHSYSQTWPKFYGEPNRQEFSTDVIETFDKGYLICGGFDDFSWLIKTNINGDTLWSKILKCENLNWINAVYQSIDGGILMCGSIQFNNSNIFPFILKLNACGEKEWCKSFFTSLPFETPTASDIKETSSGEIVVLVNRFNGPENVYLFKLNSEGDLLWKKPLCSGSLYPGSDSPLGHQLIITSNNEYLISGYVYWENPWGPIGTVFLRPLFIKVDSIGNEQWVLPYGLQDTIYGTAENILELNDSLLLGTGSYWTNQEYVEPLFMMINENGDEIDHKVLLTSQIDSTLAGGSFEYSTLDSCYLYSGGFFSLPQNFGNYITLAKLKLNLNLQNFDIIPIFNNNYEGYYYPYTLATTLDKKLLNTSSFKIISNKDISLSKLNLNLEYDTAYTGNYIYDSLCLSGPPQSGFVFLDDCDINTGTEIPSPEEYYSFIATIPITTYPNPAETEITMAFQNTEHHSNMLLECYNLYGQRVHSEKIWKGQQKTKLDVSSWGKGLYVAVVKSNGKVAGQVRFVRR